MTDQNQNQSPFEKILNLDPGSTPVFDDKPLGVSSTAIAERGAALTDPTTGEIVARTSVPTLEEINKEERLEDLHIDGQLENIHDSAIIAFEKSSRMADEVDPKFAARNAEVAAQYLKIALDSVSTRIDAKHKRAKVRQGDIEAGKSSINNNTVIVTADRNELLRQILGGKAIEDGQVIEGKVIES